jgi:hypothetical protein
VGKISFLNVELFLGLYLHTSQLWTVWRVCLILEIFRPDSIICGFKGKANHAPYKNWGMLKTRFQSLPKRHCAPF